MSISDQRKKCTLPSNWIACMRPPRGCLTDALGSMPRTRLATEYALTNALGTYSLDKPMRLDYGPASVRAVLFRATWRSSDAAHSDGSLYAASAEPARPFRLTSHDTFSIVTVLLPRNVAAWSRRCRYWRLADRCTDWVALCESIPSTLLEASWC